MRARENGMMAFMCRVMNLVFWELLSTTHDIFELFLVEFYIYNDTFSCFVILKCWSIWKQLWLFCKLACPNIKIFCKLEWLGPFIQTLKIWIIKNNTLAIQLIYFFIKVARSSINWPRSPILSIASNTLRCWFYPHFILF